MAGFESVEEIKRAHKGHWFDPDSMRFFRSRVIDSVYGGRYFVSSEQRRPSLTGAAFPRLYSIREASPEGDIRTVGDFQGYDSAVSAKCAAARLATARETAESSGLTVDSYWKDGVQWWRIMNRAEVLEEIAESDGGELRAWARAAELATAAKV